MVTSVESKPLGSPSLPEEVYDAESFRPRNSIGSLIGHARDAITLAVERGFAANPELAPYELSFPQLKIVASLATAQEAKSASDLCKSISYDAGAMTRMIDRLESKGLLHRERCTSDRRLVYLELTQDGVRLWPKMKEATRRSLNAMLSGFTRQEAQQLESYLRRMLENS
ncbi:MAG: MarR family transcriptional regulator [Steroidobacteraceae bacterium]